MRQLVEVIQERTSVEDFRQRTYVEWQTRALANFLAGLSMSKEGGQAMAKAAASLSIFGDRPSEDGENGQAAPPNQPVNKGEPKAGSFEKLNMLFGGRPNVRHG